MNAKYVWVIMFILCAVSVSASKLDIDFVEISSDDEVLESGRSGDFDVLPGQELEIEIRLENNYADSTDNDIDDVEVSARIEDIDEGYDIYDWERVDVRADGYKKVRLKLEIPNDASGDQSYDLEIVASGYDQNGTRHEDSVDFDVEVEREEHELEFGYISMGDVGCDGLGRLRLRIENVGEDEEEDVELVVRSDSIGQVYRTEFDIDSIVKDNDNTYEFSRSLDLQDLSPGYHTLTIEVSYHRDSIIERVEFDVASCSRKSDDDSDEDDNDDEYVNPKRDLSFLYGDTTAATVYVPRQNVVYAQDVPNKDSTNTKNDGSDDTFGIIILAVANIVIIVFIIFLAKYAMDNRY